MAKRNRTRGNEQRAELLEILPRTLEDRLKGKRFRQGQHHPANAHLNRGADLQELHANRVALRLGQLRLTQAKIAQRTHDDVGHRRQAHPHLVGTHRLATDAVSEQEQLLLLDTVLHVAAGTIFLLVQRLCSECFWRKRRDYETRILALGQVLGLADDTSLTAPGLVRLIGKILEHARRLFRGLELLLGLVHFRAQNPLQARVFRESEQEIDATLFTPTHQIVAAESAVATHQNRHGRPRLAQRRYDALQMLEQTDRLVELRRPQQRQQRKVAAENVQGQVAMLVVVAVKKAAKLMAVQREVGGVLVEDDARRRHDVLLHERLDEERLHRVQMSDDLLVTAVGIGADRREFEAIERALAGQSFPLVAAASVLAQRIFLADQHREQGIVTQLIVIVEIFVVQTQTEDALLEKFFERVLDALGIAVIGEAARELSDEAELGLDFTQQQSAGIGSDLAAIKASDDIA